MDIDIFNFFNKTLSAPWLDIIMIYISKPWFWIPLYALIVFYTVKKFKKSSLGPILLLAITIGATDSISSRIVKPLVNRPRPCTVVSLHANTPAGISITGSYFSAHASNHAALAVLILFLFTLNNFWKLLVVFWPIIIGISRIYLGKHYPSDVLAGWLFGIAIALIAINIFKLISNKKSKLPLQHVF